MAASPPAEPSSEGPALRALRAAPLLAARHGLLAVLVDEGQIVDRSAAVRAEVRAVVAQGERHRAALLGVLGAFATARVDVVPLKGYALGRRLYRAPLVRASSDVDVLVRDADVAAATAALEGLGYRRAPDPAVPDPHEAHHHLAFVGPCTVELHFALSSSFGRAAIAPEDVWRRARREPLEGLPAWRLGDEDELVYLASHAAAHGFLRLGWLWDLHLLLGAQPVDVRALARTARAARLGAAVGAALLATRAAFGTALPAGLLDALGLGRARALALQRLLTVDSLLQSAWTQAPRAQALRLALSDGPRSAADELKQGLLRVARRAASGGLRVGLG